MNKQDNDYALKEWKYKNCIRHEDIDTCPADECETCIFDISDKDYDFFAEAEHDNNEMHVGLKYRSDSDLERIADKARKAIDNVLVEEGISEDERRVFWQVWKGQ